MTTAPKFGFALEYVEDIEASKTFYETVLGLKVERYHPTYVQFENFAIASDETVGSERKLELYWLVDDAQAAFAELSNKAMAVTPMKDLPFGQVFSVSDPDGNERFVLELAKNRPSQAAS